MPARGWLRVGVAGEGVALMLVCWDTRYIRTNKIVTVAGAQILAWIYVKLWQMDFEFKSCSLKPN